jgi:hypothetical protein
VAALPPVSLDRKATHGNMLDARRWKEKTDTRRLVLYDRAALVIVEPEGGVGGAGR